MYSLPKIGEVLNPAFALDISLKKAKADATSLEIYAKWVVLPIWCIGQIVEKKGIRWHSDTLLSD